MAELKISNLVDNFNKAIIIDFDDKAVLVVKDGNLKIYSEYFYNQLVGLLHSKIGIDMPFED